MDEFRETPLYIFVLSRDGLPLQVAVPYDQAADFKRKYPLAKLEPGAAVLYEPELDRYLK